MQLHLYQPAPVTQGPTLITYSIRQNNIAPSILNWLGSLEKNIYNYASIDLLILHYCQNLQVIGIYQYVRRHLDMKSKQYCIQYEFDYTE